MYRFTIAVTLSTSLFSLIGLAQAETSEFQQPNAYAVVIGISQYREEVIPKVAYAVRDAQAIATLLETQGGIPKTHIKLLTDSKATLADFRNHVGDWLKMRVKPDSTVYVYYSGHGTPNPKTGEAFLVPWEGHPDFPSGLYPLNELYATLNKLPAKEIIVLLDSCFSGAAGRSVLAKGARPMVVSVENPLLAGGKIVVLAAATGNQISSDYDKAGHGLFTYELLNGLQGEADANHDGIVTLQEVFPYVREHVAQTAVDELNREQTPVLLPGEAGGVARVTLPLTRAMARKITGEDGAPMMLVPEGEFLYGDNKQRLSLSAFYMDKYEVTTSQYAKFMAATGTKEPEYWQTSVLVSNGKKPVVGVTWYEAEAYCQYYGKRLPSEQEWEKAARGTDGRKYPWGNEEPTSRHANFDPSGKDERYWQGYSTLASVESYEAGKSPYGLYNMAGNVWEWTSSDSDSNRKVTRGGSWMVSADDLASTIRFRIPPRIRSVFDGFRCAQVAP